MEALGNFDDLAAAYREGRQGFSDDVFYGIERIVGGLRGKYVLDVGCGTGIATRELSARGARIVGTDSSAGMLMVAERESPDIAYMQAPASKLPFREDMFDLITAFSAFHWFSDGASIKEVLRVLRKGRAFVVVNKNDTSGIRKDVVEFFKPYSASPTGKENYSPAEILKPHFGSVRIQIFRGEEKFNLEKGMQYLESIALWNLVPASEKESLRGTIREHFTKIYKEERVLKRDVETVVVIAHKT